MPICARPFNLPSLLVNIVAVCLQHSLPSQPQAYAVACAGMHPSVSSVSDTAFGARFSRRFPSIMSLNWAGTISALTRAESTRGVGCDEASDSLRVDCAEPYVRLPTL